MDSFWAFIYYFWFILFVDSGEWNDVLTFVEGCDYPMPRYGHASTTNNNSVLYIHGGHIKYDNRKFGFTSELLSLDLATMTWKVESPHFSKHPSNQQTLNAVFGKPRNYLMLHRDYHTSAYINNKIILFGGRSKLLTTIVSIACNNISFVNIN